VSLVPLALPLAAALAYALGARRAGGWPRARTLAWAAGVAALALALSPPLHAWADARLSGHMVQHLLLTMVAAPLLVAGAPVRLALRGLERRGRRRLAGVLHSPAARVLAQPATGWAAFTAVLVGTHLVTPLYDLAVRDPAAHAIEHLAYLTVALLYWAPLVAADPLPVRLGSAGRLAWLLASMPPMGLVGAWLLSGPVRYPVYAAPGALADQREAASIMWAGGTLVLALATVALTFAALLAEEQRQQRRDAIADRAVAL
jgi:cytochrome c oxidase assembly factor CtaG